MQVSTKSMQPSLHILCVEYGRRITMAELTVPIQIDVEQVKQIYQQGAREFAEWLPQHFDLRFSNNPDVWLDEFFNHTKDKVLAEWQKGK